MTAKTGPATKEEDGLYTSQDHMGSMLGTTAATSVYAAKKGLKPVVDFTFELGSNLINTAPVQKAGQAVLKECAETAVEALKPVIDFGVENVITSNPVQTVGQIALTGCTGVAGAAVIGAGTALETSGALIATAGAAEIGGALATAGYAITGTGCAVANTAITAVSAVAGESLIGGAIVTGLEAAAGTAFAIASSPAIIIGGGIALGIGAFVHWLNN